jgi:dUTP pyrophosphatase
MKRCNFIKHLIRMSLLVKKLTPNAVVPSRAHRFDAGMDLTYSRDDPIVIEPGKRALVPIDISIQMESASLLVGYEHYFRIAPRSGLAYKSGIDVGAGVVDSHYTGNVGVVLFNFGDTPFTVSKGDRVAQLIVERILTVATREVTELPETERGSGGFGSTGK